MDDYLSLEESEAFKIVKNFLEREGEGEGDAVERAKKLKKQEEKAKELEINKRKKLAEPLLLKSFDSEHLPSLILNAIALSRRDPYLFESLDTTKLKEIKIDNELHPSKIPYQRVVNQVRRSFKAGIDSLVSSIADRNKPIEQLLQEEIKLVENLIAEIETNNSEVLNNFSRWLVEQQLIETNSKSLTKDKL